jgi:hypothetical protein
VGGGLVTVVGLTARMIVECMPSATWWVGVISMVVKPAVARLAWYFGEGEGLGHVAGVGAAFGAFLRGEVVVGDDVGDADPGAGTQ